MLAGIRATKVKVSQCMILPVAVKNIKCLLLLIDIYAIKIQVIQSVDLPVAVQNICWLIYNV